MLNSVDVDTVEESPVPALEFNLLAVRGLSINLTALSHIKWTIKKLWAIIYKKTLQYSTPECKSKQQLFFYIKTMKLPKQENKFSLMFSN